MEGADIAVTHTRRKRAACSVADDVIVMVMVICSN